MKRSRPIISFHSVDNARVPPTTSHITRKTLAVVLLALGLVCDAQGGMISPFDQLNVKNHELQPQFTGNDDVLDNMSRASFEARNSILKHEILSHEHSAELYRHRELQTIQQCRIALAIGDTNRDDILSRDEEYVLFVNQLSGRKYSSVSSFDGLPDGLQGNYDTNAGSSGDIDISGSKPGQTATPEQDAIITALCDSTIAAFSVGDTAGPQQIDTGGGSPSPSAVPDGISTPKQPSGNVQCTESVPRTQCNTALTISDLSRDDLLDQNEYIQFINRLSGNEFAGATFDGLPVSIKDSFNKFATDGGEVNIFGSKPGQSPDSAQDQFIDDFCCESDLAVSNPGVPTAPIPGPPSEPVGEPSGDGEPTTDCTGTIPRSQCSTAISIADLSRDNLMDDSEYIRFVNRLASNEYAGSSFDQLPGNIQQNFINFAGTAGQVDVFGAKPGQTASPEQDSFLTAFCCETDLVVQNPGPSAPTSTPPIDPSVIPSPTPPTDPAVPTPVESFPPTFAEIFCRTSMASSDFNRDDKLNEEEYVRFLNRLTSNEFAGITFEKLDTPLQENFADLAGSDGQIDVFGSKPAQTPDDAQDALLDQICLETAVALDRGDGTQPPSSVDPPTDGESSFPPTFGQSTCYTAMAASDFNRDDYQNEEEFVRFLNRLTGNQFAGLSFSKLPEPLIRTYSELSSSSENGEIYIFGSKLGQTASEDQGEFLEKLCLDVALALNQANGAMPVAPSTPPVVETPAAPTFAPGFSEVYNSFIVANTIGLTAGDLQTGANRQGLDDAYREFSRKAINQLSAVVANTRRQVATIGSLRHRRIVVELSLDSDEIYLLLDNDCPEDIVARSTCQTAFAKFAVSITDEDPQEISDEYTVATQVMISNGLLQTTLSEVDPSSLLLIVNSSFPVTTTLQPTPAPVADAPSAAPPPDNGGGGKSLAGPIVGGVLGGILFCAAIGYVSTNGLPCSTTMFARGGKQAGNDDEGGFGRDDDGSVGGGALEDNDNVFDDEDDYDRGPEQSRNKNVFGFGKKNKPDSDDQGFGGDDDDDVENDFDRESGAGITMPGGMYAFDDPSEVAEKDDNEGSVGGNNENFGASPSSPGWGNGDNAFGGRKQEWGADSSNGAGENFFGGSTFGNDEEEKRSHSGSGSEAYSSSEDSTYQSDNVDGDENSAEEGSYLEEQEGDSYSRSSAGEESESYNSESTPGSLDSELKRKNEDMEAAIASGNWDAVAEAADNFGRGQDSSLEGSSKKDSLENENEERNEDDSYNGSSRSGSASGSVESATSATTTTEQREERAEYRAQVDALVRLVLPDETDKVDAMMDQFKGREAELVSTLQTMQERSANQRARAAVHKSKNRPHRPEGADGAYAVGVGGGVQGGEGAAAGTAAIAAASLPIPAAGMYDEADGNVGGERQDGFEGDAFGVNNGAPDDFEGEERSYYSDEGSRSQYSDEESFSDEESRSQYTEDGSQSRSSYTEEGSHRSNSQSSYRGGDESQSYVSGEGSQSYGEGSLSYRSGKESPDEGTQSSVSQSYRSGEGSRTSFSGHSGSRSRSQRSYEDEEGTFEEDGSFIDEGSQESGEEGSYYSEEGEESFNNGKGSFGEE